MIEPVMVDDNNDAGCLQQDKNNEDSLSTTNITLVPINDIGKEAFFDKVRDKFPTSFLEENCVFAIEEVEPHLLRLFTNRNEKSASAWKKGGRKVKLLGKEVCGDILLACTFCGYHSSDVSNVRRHHRKQICMKAKDRGYSKEDLKGLSKKERVTFLNRLGSRRYRARCKMKRMESDKEVETPPSDSNVVNKIVENCTLQTTKNQSENDTVDGNSQLPSDKFDLHPMPDSLPPEESSSEIFSGNQAGALEKNSFGFDSPLINPSPLIINKQTQSSLYLFPSIHMNDNLDALSNLSASYSTQSTADNNTLVASDLVLNFEESKQNNVPSTGCQNKEFMPSSSSNSAYSRSFPLAEYDQMYKNPLDETALPSNLALTPTEKASKTESASMNVEIEENGKKVIPKGSKCPPVRKRLQLGPVSLSEPVERHDYDLFTVADNGQRIAWKPKFCHKASSDKTPCQIVFKGARRSRRCLSLPLPYEILYRKLDCRTHRCHFTLFHPRAREQYAEDENILATIKVRIYADTVMTEEFRHYLRSLLFTCRLKPSQAASHITNVWNSILEDRQTGFKQTSRLVSLVNADSVSPDGKKGGFLSPKTGHNRKPSKTIHLSLSKQTVRALFERLEEENNHGSSSRPAPDWPARKPNVSKKKPSVELDSSEVNKNPVRENCPPPPTVTSQKCTGYPGFYVTTESFSTFNKEITNSDINRKIKSSSFEGPVCTSSSDCDPQGAVNGSIFPLMANNYQHQQQICLPLESNAIQNPLGPNEPLLKNGPPSYPPTASRYHQLDPQPAARTAVQPNDNQQVNDNQTLVSEEPSYFLPQGGPPPSNSLGGPPPSNSYIYFPSCFAPSASLSECTNPIPAEALSPNIQPIFSHFYHQ